MRGAAARTSLRRFCRHVCLGIAGISVTLLAGCGAGNTPGKDIVGVWTGIYSWDFGRSYSVTLHIPAKSVRSAGKSLVRFEGVESATYCDRVEVAGTFDTKSLRITLDEVATECADFVLAGLYEGQLSTESGLMTLVWGSGDENEEAPQGTLELSRVSSRVPDPS